MTQINENMLAEAELKRLDDDDKIFKMVGPILVPQEHETALETVQRRIEMLKKNFEAVNDQITTLEKSLRTAHMAAQKASSK
jgi:prefoldin beta subunit